MRRTRVFGAAVSVAVLLGATAAAGGSASAATNGVGTSRATTTVLNVALGSNGSLLNVRLVGDDGTANIDPKQGTPSSAASSLSPLTTTSSVSALNLALPKVSVASTGAADNKSVPPISLATPLTTGSISPLSLSAVVDSAQGAAAGLNSSLSSVTAVAGLLSVPSVTSSLGTAAKPADSDSLRGLDIPSIDVLNLGAVLQGLGINASALQLSQVGNVMGTLGVTVPFGSGTLSGSQLVTQINGITTTLANTPVDTPPGISTLPGATPIAGLAAPLQAIINGLFPGGTLPPGVTDITGLTTALNSQITSLLTSALNGISGAPLLQVKDLVVGITTKAADTVAGSTADIQASLGSVKVGNLTVPGVDLASLLSNANTTINTVLTQAGLGNLITVKALDQSKSVGTASGYVDALANLTGVHVAIAPLSSLANGTAQASSSTMGQLFTAAGGGAPPVLSPAMATLNGLLPTTSAAALGDGATVDVLSVGSASAFVPASTPSNPPAATPQTGTLATTGGPTQILGLVGLLLLATVVGLRWLRRPAPTN